MNTTTHTATSHQTHPSERNDDPFAARLRAQRPDSRDKKLHSLRRGTTRSCDEASKTVTQFKEQKTGGDWLAGNQRIAIQPGNVELIEKLTKRAILMGMNRCLGTSLFVRMKFVK